MKLAKYFVFCGNTQAYEPFNTLKEIREYVYNHHHSDFCDFRGRFVYDRNGERLYVIRVKAHPFFKFAQRVTLSPFGLLSA